MTKRIDLVLPLSSHGRADSDIERARRLLLPSLRYLDRGSLGRLLVMAPGRDLPAIERLAAEFAELSIDVIDEDRICPRPLLQRGWRRQQVLKLGAAERLCASHYLTLDADVVATRPIDADDLVIDGRALTQRASLRVHWPWHVHSARLLRLPPPETREAPCMGVTPAVLSRERVVALLRHLEQLYPRQRWHEALARRSGWTEYALYWAFLESRGEIAEHHCFGPPDLYGECIWKRDRDRFDAEWVERMFHRDATHLFSIVQSNAHGLSLDEVCRRLEPRLS